MGQKKSSIYTLQNVIRALRLSFCTASILPYILGALLARDHFIFPNFFLGLIAVLATHLSANLMNDYADSRSGADWQDRGFYNFFGGSKLIQENVFTERIYLNVSIACAAIAFFCVLLLALILKSLFIIAAYLVILLSALSYSHRPLQLAYRRMGEFVIFILFGPVLVMGGYFIQTGLFPTAAGFVVSLPAGFLTTAILFANEVPDYPEDRKAAKFTWVSISGADRAFIFYYFLLFLAFSSIAAGVILGYFKPLAFLSFLFIFPALKAAAILKKYPAQKLRLMESSKLTILVQALVSIVLIFGVLR